MSARRLSMVTNSTLRGRGGDPLATLGLGAALGAKRADAAGGLALGAAAVGAGGSDLEQAAAASNSTEANERRMGVPPFTRLGSLVPNDRAQFPSSAR